MECSESTPSKTLPFTGTPMTGSAVMAATIPGRCAAPPAPAMMHLSPLPAASRAYWTMRSGVRCADTTVSSYGTSNFSSICAAAAIVGRSESEPMMMPTSGVREGTWAARGSGVYLDGREDDEGSERAKMGRRRDWSSASDEAVTVMWPILRPLRHSALPYRWTDAPGTPSAARTHSSIESWEEERPMRLMVAAEGVRRAVEPRGSERIARRWFSNWDVWQASMVWWPELCGRGAISLISRESVHSPRRSALAQGGRRKEGWADRQA